MLKSVSCTITCALENSKQNPQTITMKSTHRSITQTAFYNVGWTWKLLIYVKKNCAGKNCTVWLIVLVRKQSIWIFSWRKNGLFGKQPKLKMSCWKNGLVRNCPSRKMAAWLLIQGEMASWDNGRWDNGLVRKWDRRNEADLAPHLTWCINIHVYLLQHQFTDSAGGIKCIRLG